MLVMTGEGCSCIRVEYSAAVRQADVIEAVLSTGAPAKASLDVTQICRTIPLWLEAKFAF